MFVDTHLNRLYVVNSGSSDISILDASVIPPVPLAKVSVPVPPLAVTVLSDGSKAFVAGFQTDPTTGKVTVSSVMIDTTSNKVVGTHSFAPVAAAYGDVVTGSMETGEIEPGVLPL